MDRGTSHQPLNHHTQRWTHALKQMNTHTHALSPSLSWVLRRTSVTKVKHVHIMLEIWVSNIWYTQTTDTHPTPFVCTQCLATDYAVDWLTVGTCSTPALPSVHTCPSILLPPLHTIHLAIWPSPSQPLSSTGEGQSCVSVAFQHTCQLSMKMHLTIPLLTAGCTPQACWLESDMLTGVRNADWSPTCWPESQHAGVQHADWSSTCRLESDMLTGVWYAESNMLTGVQHVNWTCRLKSDIKTSKTCRLKSDVQTEVGHADWSQTCWLKSAMLTAFQHADCSPTSTPPHVYLSCGIICTIVPKHDSSFSRDSMTGMLMYEALPSSMHPIKCDLSDSVWCPL